MLIDVELIYTRDTRVLNRKEEIIRDVLQAIYTNRFQLSVNANGQEVLIAFSQQQPIWDPDTNETLALKGFHATSVVMSIATAKDLIRVLSEGIAAGEKEHN